MLRGHRPDMLMLDLTHLEARLSGLLSPNDLITELVDRPAYRGEAKGHTVFVDDLDGRVESIGARGIEPASRETYGSGVRKVITATSTATRSASAAPRSSDRRVRS